MSRAERTEAAREAIKLAVADGFMDCRAIVRALYPERFPDRPVRWEAAYRWMKDVGLDVVYIAPDGDTDVPKAERTGCWGTDFPKVKAYKEAYYLQIALNDWNRNVEGGVRAGLSQEESEEMMGARPLVPAFWVDTAWKAGGTKPKEAPVSDGQDNRVIDAMRSWTGPRNKKGKPKVGALSAAVGFGVTRERRNELWAQLWAQLNPGETA